MKRFAAVVGAGSMILIAVAVRAVFDDDAGGVTTVGPPGRSVGELTCATQLTSACEAAALELRPSDTAGATADALVAAANPAEVEAVIGGGWVTTSAWAELVVAERDRLGLEPLVEVSDVGLASNPLTLVVWADRATELEERCGELDWTCLADQTDSTLATGGRVAAGMPTIDSTFGLVVAGWQAADLLGRTDYASNDFGAADFRAAVRSLADGQRADPVRRMRTAGPGELTAAGTVALDDDAPTSNFGRLELRSPGPPVRATVVALVPTGGPLLDAEVDALRKAFTDEGWEAPADAGLPGGGVMAAVRSLWAASG